MIKHLLLPVALLAVGAGPTPRFNLVCTGTHTHRTMSGDKDEPWSETYRIDLDAKVYCTGACIGNSPLADVSPTRIDFWPHKTEETQTSKVSSGFAVNRETGKLTGFMSSEDPRRFASMILDEWDADCIRAEFSGFPAPPATKF